MSDVHNASSGDASSSAADTPTAETSTAEKAPAKKATAKKATAKKAPAKKATAKKATAKKATAKKAPATTSTAASDAPEASKTAATKKTATKKAATKKAAASEAATTAAEQPPAGTRSGGESAAETAAPTVAPLFQAPDPAATPPKQTAKKTAKKTAKTATKKAPAKQSATSEPAAGSGPEVGDLEPGESDGEGGQRRRRRRGGRRRRKGPGEGPDAGDNGDETTDESGAESRGDADASGDSESGDGGTSRRRRRRRRSGDNDGDTADDPENTVTRVRKPRSAEDEITGFTGSTRLEAKKQRRREGREAGRRRAPIISEAEFLARREAVDRTMVIRQRNDLTQIAVLEDKVLVEHYVARESQTSLIGNVYLGRVQNVLPSMEAAFIDIGKGRNAVLYAGEVNWDSLGAKEGNQRKIEQVLKSGQSVLVQVTKDPIGHKGARLTSQVSLPGRFLVYVPDGTTSGISRKLPENERNRLKTLLKEIVPDTAGVIVRTAAEGASEDELTRDVERLTARWEDIEKKVESGNAPQLLYGEPDLTVKVVRDLFTEDFAKLVISGSDAWEMVEGYVSHVAPDLHDRLEKHDDSERDAFADYRIDEQIAKGLDRKVWLPSGGSLVIDRTEAMTVVDVNTGKFTGAGGNLEETVTKNNLEAAEEIVRQLRLRDIGGIIVVDFIDMVLENNRDLVLRRLIECLGRDRTRHQVAEVTSLGLVQMTRKRIGTGLLEAFSESCEHCQGRGLIVHGEPVEPKKSKGDDEPRRTRRSRGRGRGDDQDNGDTSSDKAGKAGDKGGRKSVEKSGEKSDGKAGDQASESSPRRPTPAEFAAMARADADADAADAAGAEPDQPRAEEPAPEEPVAEEPVAEEPEPAPEPAPEPVPTGPRIVTSVRRGGARRAAGPPAAPGAHRMESAGSAGAAGTEDGDGVPHALDHVPVKKKGARKR